MSSAHKFKKSENLKEISKEIKRGGGTQKQLIEMTGFSQGFISRVLHDDTKDIYIKQVDDGYEVYSVKLISVVE